MERRTERYDARYRRTWRLALLASVVLHVLILLLFRENLVLPPSPFAAAGAASGDIRAAAGGGSEILAFQTAAPERMAEEEPVVEAVPVPVPDPEVRVEMAQVERPDVAIVRDGRALAGQGQGTAAGEGTAAGQGAGGGGTGEEGRFRALPPTPRGLILPPSDRPGSVRGKEIAVWVFVDVAGGVVADSTRIDPTSGDSKFDDRLKKQASEWVFEPARRAGQAVPEWFRYVVVL